MLTKLSLDEDYFKIPYPEQSIFFINRKQNCVQINNLSRLWQLV